VIPAALRKAAGITAGSYVRVEGVADGIFLSPLGPNLAEALMGAFADTEPMTEDLIAEGRAEAAPVDAAESSTR
jgi:bifunctional DNA-binding transcriptional regulator/antitoxin component of YhaV-PrlF toxin-antitoxin module